MVRHSARSYHSAVVHGINSHADHLLITESAARNLRFFVSARWDTPNRLEAIVGERLFEITYRQTDVHELVCEFGPGLVYIRQLQNTVIATIAAPDRDSGDGILAGIRTALPDLTPDEDTVPSLFWWMSNSPRSRSSMIPILDWDAIAPNYVGDAHAALQEMCGWNRPPPGGRLIVWHGAPGTGKTSALRLLAGAWRKWANFHFVTDPERFLNSPAYLLEVLTENREPDQPENEWRVIVLEDAGEFLAPDAMHQNGQAVSRLLNVCDGVVGQSMRALIMLTTNEPLRRLQPALTRPGRLLRSSEFNSMNAQQATDWLAGRGIDLEAPKSAMTLAELFALAERRAPSLVDQTPKVGFGHSESAGLAAGLK